jgi:hypothetical protein
MNKAATTADAPKGAFAKGPRNKPTSKRNAKLKRKAQRITRKAYRG